MTRRQKARLGSIIIICILLIASVYLYCVEMNEIVKPVGYSSDVNIDGSDFTQIINVFVLGANGLVGFAAGIAYGIALAIVSLILLLPWRLIAIRNNSDISYKEVIVARLLLIFLPVLSLISGFAVTGAKGVVSVTVMSIVVFLMYLILGYMPYESVQKKEQK